MDWMDDYLNGMGEYKTTVSPADTHIWGPAKPSKLQQSLIQDSMAFDVQQMHLIKEARQELERHGAALGIGADPGSTVWPNVQLFNFSVSTTNGIIEILWGDGTSNTLSSEADCNHSFFCPSSPAASGFWNNIQPCKTSLTNMTINPEFGNNTVTSINCGTSSPKLSGTISLSAFTNLNNFTCIYNDIIDIKGYEKTPTLKSFSFQNNKVTGTIPNLSANTQLENFYCNNNELSGSIPSLNTNTQLLGFYCNNNRLTGLIPNLNNNTQLSAFYCQVNQLSGSIPSLNTNTQLKRFYCSNNQLSGSIPSLNTNTQLERFYCSNNRLSGSIPNLSFNIQLQEFYCTNNRLTGSIPSLSANIQLQEFYCNTNQLTGSIPSLSANTQLREFYCNSNRLSGTIPNLSANTQLEKFYCNSNKLTNFNDQSVSITLGDFQAHNNLLTSSSINTILSTFVAANKITDTRILNLGGTGNATPTGQGITDKAILISRGWTVTTN
jgi:Leucine-rich repeat (LRR) protein